MSIALIVATLAFGPEPSGLTNDEVSLCHALVHIPADPAYPAVRNWVETWGPLFRTQHAVRRLLAATVSPAARAPAEQSLIEPLSERELDVLRLLASELDGPDIARELSVSVATMRTHTRNIYAKLALRSRSELTRWMLDVPAEA